MAPLSEAETRVLQDFFTSRRGTRCLIAASAEKLVGYFQAKGTPLAELPTTRPADSSRVDAWLEEWTDAAEAAGITDKLDVKNVARFMGEEDTAARAGTRSGKAAAVADALVRKGFAVDRATELAISTAIAQADAGDMQAQCRDVNVVWLIYVGQSPGEEGKIQFLAKRNATNSADGSDPSIDLRLFASHAKQMSKTSVPTLERALRDRTGATWANYSPHVQKLLVENGYMHASQRWMRVYNYAKQMSGGHSARERRYLQLYFFEEHMGKGLPEEKCIAAALMATSLDPFAPQQELKATVPSEGSADSFDWAPSLSVIPPPNAPSGSGYGAWPSPQQMWAMTVLGMQPGMQPSVGQQGGMQMMQGQPPIGMPFAPPPALGALPSPQIEEMIEPAEQMPCLFCGAPKHSQSKCTLYIQARNQTMKQKQEQAASKRAAAEAKAAEKAATAAAAAAAAGVPAPP